MPNSVSKLSSDRKKRELRDPPGFFCAERLKVWEDVLDRCPIDLRVEHRDIVAQFVMLLHRSYIAQEPLKSAESNLLLKYANLMGMAPPDPKAQSDVPKSPGRSDNPNIKHTFTRFKTPPTPKRRRAG